MKLPKAVIFDWDNTLVSTWPIICSSLQQAFIDMGMEPWTDQEIQNNKGGIHRALRESFPEIFGSDWEKARDFYYAHFKAIHLEKLQILEGTENILKFLESKNIPMFVVSNKTGGFLREEVASTGLAKYFDNIIGALDATRDKPHPEPIMLALKNTNIQLDKDIWMIGDSSTDMDFAKNCGISAILFGEHVMDDAHIIKHVKNHKDLLAVLTTDN